MRPTRRKDGQRPSVGLLLQQFERPLFHVGIVTASIVLLLVTVVSYARLPQRLGLRQECRMSYMWPTYADYTDRLASPSGLSSKYRLLLYREGYLEPKPDAFPPNGKPALFIPGNAGSYGQIRSVASSSAKQYWAHDYGQQSDPSEVQIRPEWFERQGGIDWWTVDFNEEFSAFHGATLAEQATFVNEAIIFLQNTYHLSNNSEVPILAHSMGGIVARLAIKIPNFHAGTIRTIVTLSAPHAYPPLSFDAGVMSVYSTINKKPSEKTRTGEEVLLVSIAGGNLDTQVASESSLLDLSDVWPREAQVSALTTSIPGLWCSVDHLAIMWCDQLRSLIARGFLLSGLPAYSAGTVQQRRATWQHALRLEDRLAFTDRDATPAAIKAVHHDGASTSTITRTIDLSDAMSAGIDLLTNAHAAPAIRLCQPSDTPCTELSDGTWTLFPPSPHPPTERFPSADGSYEKTGLLHVRVLPETIRSHNASRLEIDLPLDPPAWLLHGIVSLPVTVAGKPGLLSTLAVPAPKTAEVQTNSLSSQDVILPDFKSSIISYRLRFVVNACQAGGTFDSLVRIQSLAARDQVWVPSMSSQQKRITINLIGRSPWIPSPSQVSTGWHISTWSEPHCPQPWKAIEVQIDWVASLAQLVIRYRSSIFVVPFVSLAFAYLAGDHFSPSDALLASALRAILPSAFFTAASLIVIEAFKRFSGRNMPDNLGASLDGLTTFEAFSVIIWIASIGSAFAFLGSLTALTLRRVLALCLRPHASKYGLKQPKKGTLTRALDINHVLPSIIVLFLVFTILPHQAVLLALFLVHLWTAALAEARVRQPGNQASATIRHWRQSHLLLMALFWCLPIKAPVLFVWVRNMLNGWIVFHGLEGSPSISTDDHDPLGMLPLLWLVQLLASMHPLLPPMQGSFARRGLVISLLAASFLATLLGLARPLVLYNNVVFAAQAALGLQAVFWVRTEPQINDERDSLDLAPLLSDHVVSVEDGQHGPTTTFATSSIPQQLLRHLGEQRGDQDDAISKHLDVVDEYLGRRALASKYLASGFLDLSKAKSQGGLFGSRIGNDGWDGRLRAQTICQIHCNGALLLREVDDDRDNLEEDETSDGDHSEHARKRPPKVRPSPLYQFGGLPSPALRRAQHAFQDALEAFLGPEGVVNAAQKLYQADEILQRPL
ncbi:PGAP1-domain-containing protein [Tilletiaria anomala UBC 951]|uniref:GPI inositol-deacylase n=1 Tax=Tilletiaria anomala (strain ATCC 24038 / CBS 436.72 / UBC 951) TaxID=1037660 RepID=A0A066VZR0_TILAU|nr:PGAP1-domain-containing protein [Tilletiaria anomala UBC 951]KDN46961.1 PGAP1-domain-containing protein [Tilletiaria anomala UBC 951]